MTENENLLLVVAEECMEVGQRVIKALRFSLEEIQPDWCLTNADRIYVELADLKGTLQLLEERGVLKRLNADCEQELMDRKKEKVMKFMEYSKQLGTVQGDIGCPAETRTSAAAPQSP